MWSSIERDAVMMDLLIDAKARSRDTKLTKYPFSTPDLVDVVNDCIVLNQNKQFMRTYSAGQVTVYIRDICLFNEAEPYAVFLLALSDKRRPDDVLSNPQKNARRDIPKTESEGNEYSCHIVIRLTPTKKAGHRYRLAYEVAPLIASIYINRFIRFVFKEVSILKGYSRPHPSGKKANQNDADEQVYIRLNTNLHAVPSQELINDLKNGTLGNIELSREGDPVKAWDDNQYTTEKKSVVVLKPSQKAIGDKISDVVDSLCASAKKKNYTIATIHWKTNDGRGTSAKFDCDSASPLDQRYIRRHTFSLSKPLPASCAAIDVPFSKSLIAWLK